MFIQSYRVYGEGSHNIRGQRLGQVHVGLVLRRRPKLEAERGFEGILMECVDIIRNKVSTLDTPLLL